MNSEQYKRYLSSDRWRCIAQDRMEIDGYRCQCCGTAGTANNRLEVHHLTYKHLFTEEHYIYEDLVTLCHVCHTGVHRMMNRVTSPDGRRGWSEAAGVPQIHVCTMSGLDYDINVIERR